MANTMHLFLVTFYIGVLFGTSQADLEPVCSKFDYEEKLLAKTIRLESTVEDLARRTTAVENTLAGLESQISKMAEMEARINETTIKKETEGQAAQPNPKVTTAFPDSTFETKDEARQTRKCSSPFKYDTHLNLCWLLERGVKLNWFDARDRCSERGADLMIVNTTHGVKFMQEWLKAVGTGDVFVGANDMMEEGAFKWSNGETVQPYQWGSGEPNGGSGSNCLVMEVDYNFQFCDRECSEKNEFLCQKFLS